jgi:maltose O-acetyltransferase
VNKISKVLLLYIFHLLPSTRLYELKTRLLHLLGSHVAESARIVSSVEFMGVKNISIGDDTFIGHETMIAATDKSSVTIGANCDISSRVTIVTGTHEVDLSGSHIAGKGIGKDIVIEDGVWIGINSTILPGVKIGKKSIVAAGSVVVHDVAPYTMVAGNPAAMKKKLLDE